MATIHKPVLSSEASASDGGIRCYLWSVNVSGNLHDVIRYCNELGWADFFVQADHSAYNSVVIFRFPIDWPCDGRGPLPRARAALLNSKWS